MDTDNKGLVAGVGFGGNGFAAALSAGTGSSDFRFDGRNDRAEVDSKYLAAHATYGSGEGLRGTVGISYAWHDIDTRRGIGGAPLAQTPTSKRDEIGRAHVCTPVTNAHLVCRLLLEKKKTNHKRTRE